MRFACMLLCLTLLSCSVSAQKKLKVNNNKQSVIANVDNNYKQLTELSDKIWSYEEIAFQETQSAKALAEYARNAGFEVKTGVADIPTALVAEYYPHSDERPKPSLLLSPLKPRH